jgi:hypothetical protein
LAEALSAEFELQAIAGHFTETSFQREPGIWFVS